MVADHIPSIELVIFDCDGVLIDSESLASQAEAEVLAQLGIALSAADVCRLYTGISIRDMLQDLERRFPGQIPIELPSMLADRTRRLFEAELKPMAGIEALLGKLSVRKCVASSSSPERLAHSLGLVGLAHPLAPYIFSACQVRRGKPQPDLFVFAAAQMRVPPHRCLVIEDSVAGVTAGKAAGMRVLGFYGGSHCAADHSRLLAKAGADWVCRSFELLDRLPILSGMFRSGSR